MLVSFIFNDKLKHRDIGILSYLIEVSISFRILHQQKAELPVAPDIALNTECLAISAYRTINCTPPPHRGTNATQVKGTLEVTSPASHKL